MRLNGVSDLHSTSGDQRRTLRLDIYLLSEILARLQKTKQLPPGVAAPPPRPTQKSLNA